MLSDMIGSRAAQIWFFHVFVLPRTTKKCTTVHNVRAQLLFFTKPFGWCRSGSRRGGGLLKVPNNRIQRLGTCVRIYVLKMTKILVHQITA